MSDAENSDGERAKPVMEPIEQQPQMEEASIAIVEAPSNPTPPEEPTSGEEAAEVPGQSDSKAAESLTTPYSSRIARTPSGLPADAHGAESAAPNSEPAPPRIPPAADSAKPSGRTPKAAPTVHATRRLSGRVAILQANQSTNLALKGGQPQPHQISSTGMANAFVFSTGPHLNGQQLTTAEENALFRARNNVSSNFRGPVYVAEDVQVPCAGCGGPLEPITRVPVGSLFFHLVCLRCCVCGMSSVTENFSQVRNTTSAICSACVAKGYEPSVRKEIIQMSQHQQHRQQQQQLARGNGKNGTSSYNGASLYTKLSPAQTNPLTTLNRPVLPGATAPSLAIGPVHTARNTSRKSFALMQRQQYFTQSDGNMIMSQSMVKNDRDGGADTYGITAGDVGESRGQPQVRAQRRSNAAANGDVPRLQ